MTTKLKTSATSRHCSEMSILEQKLGPIEYRPVDHLKRYENNPRKHPEKQIVKLAASIRKFGFAIPVVVDEAGILIAGEARVEAARRVGLQNVPVIVAYHWSGEQVPMCDCSHRSNGLANISASE